MLRNRKIAALIGGLLILVFAACTPQGGPVPNTGATPFPDTAAPGPSTGTPGPENPLAATRWALVSVGEPGAETPVLQGTEITLEFEEAGQAGGSGGCNSYGAEYEIQDGKLSFDQIVTTEMACLDEGVMEQEQRYYQALQAAGEFELAGDQLKIWFDNRQGVLNFARALPATPEATSGAGSDLAGTQWMLESFGSAGTVESVQSDFPITLAFDDAGQAGGSGGCNTYGAAYQVQDGVLSFGPVNSTKRACADNAATQQEQRFFQALQAAGAFELSEDRLVITYGDGQETLTFVRMDPVPASTTTVQPQ
jgi:heat shock protein HslJ